MINAKTIKIEVTRCRNCPHVTNSARLHADPFTSTPLKNHWYCTATDKLMSLDDETKIDKRCPL